jgi:hypothetical protein
MSLLEEIIEKEDISPLDDDYDYYKSLDVSPMDDDFEYYKNLYDD